MALLFRNALVSEEMVGGKKICVLMSGVTRPNPKRVLENIIKTLETLSEFDTEFYILTYETEQSIEFKWLIEESGLNVKFYLIPPITENIGGHNGNTYRMFKTTEILWNNVPDIDKFDLILRTRLDSEIEEIDFPNELDDDTYYSPEIWGLIFDNIGIAKPSVFKQVWHTDGLVFDNPHVTLVASIKNNNFNMKPFNFKQTLYQSEDVEVLGVPQWSRKNRVFIYKNGWVRTE